MPFKTIAVRATLAAVLAVSAAPAFAGSATNQSEMVVNANRAELGEAVPVHDADFAGSRPEASLIHRIRTAATAACDARPGIILEAMQGYNWCVDALVADARIALPSRAQLAERGGSVTMILR